MSRYDRTKSETEYAIGTRGPRGGRGFTSAVRYSLEDARETLAEYIAKGYGYTSGPWFIEKHVTTTVVTEIPVQTDGT